MAPGVAEICHCEIRLGGRWFSSRQVAVAGVTWGQFSKVLTRFPVTPDCEG